MQHQVFLSIGSNYQRKLHLKQCYECLRQTFSDIIYSHIYQSVAVGAPAPSYYNQVICVLTTQDMIDCWHTIKNIEKDCGRIKNRRATRHLIPIDIDLLLYDSHICDTAPILPHPDMLTKTYILKPLCDLIPQKRHPVTQRTYYQHWLAIQSNTQSLASIKNLSQQKEDDLCR